MFIFRSLLKGGVHSLRLTLSPFMAPPKGGILLSKPTLLLYLKGMTSSPQITQLRWGDITIGFPSINKGDAQFPVIHPHITWCNHPYCNCTYTEMFLTTSSCYCQNTNLISLDWFTKGMSRQATSVPNGKLYPHYLTMYKILRATSSVPNRETLPNYLHSFRICNLSTQATPPTRFTVTRGWPVHFQLTKLQLNLQKSTTFRYIIFIHNVRKNAFPCTVLYSKT